MIVGRVHVSFDRGTATNQPRDLGLSSPPKATEDGLVLRGLGTHYRSRDAQEQARLYSNEEQRVRQAFKERFVASPIPGVFVLPEKGAAGELLAELDVMPGVEVNVSEYVLEVLTQSPAEVEAWAKRIEKQLQAAPLGRAKGKDWAESKGGDRGLQVLGSLSACPILADSTRADLRELIADAKLQRLDRVDFVRKVAALKVEVEAPDVTPRRVARPQVEPEASEDGPILLAPRRRRA